MLELVESRVMDKLCSVDESKIDSPQEIKKMVQANFTEIQRNIEKEAQYNLGYCYYYGHGVTQSCEEAKIWLQKAADQGDQRANDLLRSLYQQN